MSDGPWPDLGTTLEDLPDDLRARIKAELDPGERLLWAAQAAPRPARAGEGSGGMSGRRAAVSFGALGLSLFAAGAALSMRGHGPQFEVSHVIYEAPGLLAAAGLGAGGIALFLAGFVVAGRSVQRIEEVRLARNLYALTDRRAILWSPVQRSDALEVYSYPRDKIIGVHRVEFPDGFGDVALKLDTGRSPYFWGPTRFHGIAGVRDVEGLVRRVYLEAPSESHFQPRDR